MKNFEVKEPLFTGDAPFGERMALCPNCESEYIHQGNPVDFESVGGGRVEVRSRDSNMNLPWKESGMPATERNACTLPFWCEECDAQLLLEIFQHKGYTRVRWKVGPGLPDYLRALG